MIVENDDGTSTTFREGRAVDERPADVETYIAAAQRHGADSEPDHEVGDIQDLLRAAWAIFTPDQRTAFGRSDAVGALLESTALDVTPAPVRKFLDLSTGHLGKESRAYLEAPQWPTVYQLEYGWLVHVPEGQLAEEMKEQEADVPPALMACLTRARALGCVYILFDADAGADDALAWFEDEQTEHQEQPPALDGIDSKLGGTQVE